ncbi:MAG: cupin domain-containing protein [Candidatus Accumulibacter phosphatis]|uniref:cupin domain-containing protein n=1 Tax=Candidatus Accumulibacter phosphatis TaxID=327160 RepID=UPI001A4307FD|nr:cupin domain-containing protein [Candidatus Accumulibacter phosphatis]
MNSEPKDYADATDDDRAERELSSLICDGLAAIELPPAQRAGLRRALLDRVGESVRRHARLLVVRAGDGIWRAVKAGIRAKFLWEGPEGASVLIEFAPGAGLPVHRHHHLEEGIVLHGRLQLGDLELGPGDYHVSPAGSRHGRISSPGGGLAYLRGTSLGRAKAVIGELLGGLVPGKGPAVHTIRASQGDWHSIAPGAEEKIVWRDGDTVSRFIRLAPGSRLARHAHSGNEECMMITGDAFFGDLLVQAGDFHLAPAGSEHGEVSSDNGALLFVRGHAPLPLPPGP